MHVSVEVSMYPLNADYIPPIDGFIKALHTHSGIEVRTNTMSTQVFGEYDTVMSAHNTEMKRAHESDEKSIFVLKVINADLSTSDE